MRASLPFIAAVVGLVAATGAGRAEPTSRQVICSLIDQAAADHSLPPSFLTRLIWRESSFRTDVKSRTGAQGIAQFMPGTAAERGLADPFDPGAAIPASASLLSELRGRFGSLELAAAAYNAGPQRIAKWKNGVGSLPAETREHVLFITGVDLATVTDGAARAGGHAARDCLTTLASIQAERGRRPAGILAAAIAPWGVQLIAGPDKAKALRDYDGLKNRLGSILAGRSPTIITTRLGGKGQRFYHRIRIAFDDRASADRLCRQMRSAGARCLAVRN